MSDSTVKVISSHGVSVDASMLKNASNDQPITAAKVVSTPGFKGEFLDVPVDKSVAVTSTNLINDANDARSDFCQIYDVKHVNSILHINQFKLVGSNDKVDTEIYNAWRHQSDFDFGFVPIGEQLLPDTQVINDAMGKSPFEIHELVKSTGRPNFMQARFPLQSQLNVEAWESIYMVTGTVSSFSLFNSAFLWIIIDLVL